MTLEALGNQLRTMYEQARRNEALCQVHLFAILYGREIREQKYRLKDLVRVAGISEGFIPEISKGIKLAKYVTIKPECLKDMDPGNKS